MTTRLPPYETAIFVKAPCSHRAWNASLSRCAWPLLNPFIGYRSQPEWGLSRDPPSLFTRSVAGCDRLFYRFLRETSKTNEGVWKETTESAPTLQLSRVAIGKRHNKWHITDGSDNVRFRRDANISNSELRQLRRRTPAAESVGDRCKSYGIVFGSAWRFYFYIWLE